MVVGVAAETFPGERRVALVPAQVPVLARAGVEVVVQAGAGVEAGVPDDSYVERGARVVRAREEVFQAADVIAAVRVAGANSGAGRADHGLLRPGQVLIGFADALSEPLAAADLARRGVSLLAMELVPRITKAQAMDALSSMATVAGYKAVLLAAGALPRLFPMLTTAAGTLQAARVFVVGAGVAGLQAIATARRLGALVEAYDVRPAVREQVQSLGARFVELGLETEGAEGSGGYARQMGEDFYRRQREGMARVVAQSDVVITTAAVPGKRAPVLVTREMVEGMRPGSVVVDIAAERGGNCEVSRPGETVRHRGVTVIAPLNLPATVPFHASQMYSKNIATLILHLTKEGRVALDTSDEITSGVLVTRDGEVVHPAVREALARGQGG